MLFRNIFLKYFNSLTHLYGNFGKNVHGVYEYYLKLDSYYYCKWQKCIIVVLRIRNKRIIDEIPLQQIILDTNYLKELHPLDTFIIGVLANHERHDDIRLEKDFEQMNMQRLKEYRCKIKSLPILEVNGQFIDRNNKKIILLRSKLFNKEFQVPLEELCQNQALLYAIDSNQAIGIGYFISEFFSRPTVDNHE